MPQIYGLVNRAKPTKTADGSQAQARGGRYGELQVENMTQGTYPLADEGSYFKATNPTFGTAIAATIQTSFAATNGLMCIFNNDSAGGKRIYLDYLSLILATVPASSTSVEFACTIDNTNRYSSGGSAITPVNPNMDDSTATISIVHFGAVTLSAASGSVRNIARGTLFGAIPVTKSMFTVNFGGVENQAGTMSGTTAVMNTDCAGPVVIGPGHSANIHFWYPANATTAGTWEFEAGWWER